MQLSKLYCNNKDFKNITFNLNELNVIYADVKSDLKEKKNSTCQESLLWKRKYQDCT